MTYEVKVGIALVNPNRQTMDVMQSNIWFLSGAGCR